MITSLKQHVSGMLGQSDCPGQSANLALVVTTSDDAELKQAFIKSAPLFSELAEAEQAAISELMVPGTYENNEILFAEGLQGDALYLIGHGWVDLRTGSQNGDILSRGPGSLVGETDFLLGRPHTQTARVSGQVMAWKLENEALTGLVNKQPGLGLKLGLAIGAGIVQSRRALSMRLAEIPLLNELADHERQAIAQHLSPHRCLPRETIFRSGSPPAGIFFIEQGSVWLFGESENDYTEIAAGEIIGQEAIIYRRPHSRTAQAATEVVMWQLSPVDFAVLAKQHPYIKASLSQNMQHHLTEALAIASLIIDREIEELSVVAGDQSTMVKKMHHVRHLLAWLKDQQELF